MQGVALSMMTFAMRYLDEQNGQKSMIKSFLSVEIWQPLAKLTFLMYMVHPIVGMWYMKDLDIPWYYSIWSGTAHICTMIAVTAGFSFILYVFMEQPISLFISAAFKRILGRGSKPKPLSRTTSKILREMKHHPSHGAGFADVETHGDSSSEDESDSDLDDLEEQTETDDLGIADIKPTVQ